jgi:hypothetical protein
VLSGSRTVTAARSAATHRDLRDLGLRARGTGFSTARSLVPGLRYAIRFDGLHPRLSVSLSLHLPAAPGLRTFLCANARIQLDSSQSLSTLTWVPAAPHDMGVVPAENYSVTLFVRRPCSPDRAAVIAPEKLLSRSEFWQCRIFLSLNILVDFSDQSLRE